MIFARVRMGASPYPWLSAMHDTEPARSFSSCQTCENLKNMEATYCPEDNKLRLYVGRVPHDEYLKLRADGWVSTPKQRENGGCDFVATWTPNRRDTCLEYADCILDEDQSPEERAADRAERFAGYRDKRTNEATGHADRYDAQPNAHGYQSQARAERAAARHDRIADHAVDAWSKAEYWTSRTAGVISHALYKSRPDVRMGRIKVLEAELRKRTSDRQKYIDFFRCWKDVEAEQDAEQQTKMAYLLVNSYHCHGDYKHPDEDYTASLYSLMTSEKRRKITGKEAAALWLADKVEPSIDSEWTLHLKLRLAYENQMLEAQGGRAGVVEMVPGGKLGNHLIVKVCKSNVTGRVVSVWIKGSKIKGYTYQAKDVAGAEYSLHQIETERLSADSYTAPTEDSLKELADHQNLEKARKSKIKPVPLINPTEADAEKLQAIWNAEEKQPAKIAKMTQAEYSARSGTEYSPCKTVTICELGTEHRSRYGENITRHDVFKVRLYKSGVYESADRVVVIVDKPQKALPWKELEKLRKTCPQIETFDLLALVENMRDKAWCKDVDQKLFNDARYLKLAYYDSESQYGLTEKGRALLKERQAVAA